MTGLSLRYIPTHCACLTTVMTLGLAHAQKLLFHVHRLPFLARQYPSCYLRMDILKARKGASSSMPGLVYPNAGLLAIQT